MGSHGAPAAGAFTVVAPSLPGFGFSGAPPAGGLTHERVAELWYQIMTGVLGYRRFAAHGSDLGAGVTARFARVHARHQARDDRCRARGLPGLGCWQKGCARHSGPSGSPLGITWTG